MRPLPSLAVTALISAVTFVTGVSAAAAADEKPAPREVVKAPAVDARRVRRRGAHRRGGLGPRLLLGSRALRARRRRRPRQHHRRGRGQAARRRCVPARAPRHRQEDRRRDPRGHRRELGGAQVQPASHLDLQTGRVVLETDAPASETERLVKEHPEIELRESKPTTDVFHRRDDIPAFWGGAAIRSGGTCSTGFTVRKPSGARFITTAAHCFSVGSTVRTPTLTFVGTVAQRGTLNSPFFWVNRDVELIGGSSYGARVYTGGVFSTTSRGVIGAGDPVAGFTGYCSSGQTSGEQCQQTVQSTSAMVCTQTGCKWPVIQYVGGPANPGDSGGSFYLPSGSSSAWARGAVIAGNGVTSYAEPWNRIASAMGVTIAT